MQRLKRKTGCGVLITAGILGLTACGGGSGGGSSTVPAPASASQISGTAASGSAFSGAAMTLTDANGTQRSATAGDDGSFTIDVTGLTAPFVVTATGTVGGITSTFVSVLADAVAAGETRTVNVTPLTHAIAALLADSGNPLDLTNVTLLKTKANAADIKKAVDALRSVLANVVTASGGNANFDPVGTPFKADHTGLDAVLDAIKVTVSDSGVVLTNALAPVAESAADATAPAASSVLLSKATLGAPPAALPAPAIAASAIATILDAWRSQINNCFALPPGDRVIVSGNVVTGVKGACANITGFDPAYKSNGYTLLQRYGDLLKDPDMTGAKFGMPDVLTLVKTEAGDDLAIFRISYKRSDGDTNHVIDVAQKKTAATANDSGWRVVGNQRDYDAAVESRFDRMTDMKTGKVQYNSGLRLYFNPLGPNASDVNAVRITGPGLPSAGVVLGRSNALGTADYLQIQNKTGTLAYSVDNANTASEFILGVANADKSPVTWQDKSNWAAAPLEDFASIRPFSRYKFEAFRNVTDVTPKAEFYVRMTAAPVAPAFGNALQWNAIGTASLGYLDPANTDKASALPSATIAWTRNPLAPPVEHINLFGSSGSLRIMAQQGGIKQAASSAVVSAVTLGSSFGAPASGSATIPALNVTNAYREIALRGRNGDDVRQYDISFYRN